MPDPTFSAQDAVPGFQRFDAKQIARIRSIKTALPSAKGKRAKLDHKELHRLYIGARQRQAQYDKTQGPMDQQIRDAVTTKFQPQADQLIGGARSANQQATNIATYGDQYRQVLDGIRAQSQAASQQVLTDLHTSSDNQATQGQAERKQMTDQLTSDAGRRGQTVDPSSIANALAAGSGRADISAAESARVAAQAKRSLDTLDAIKATSFSQQAQMSQTERNKAQGLLKQLAQLKGAAADYAGSTKSKILSDQATQALQQQALGIKGATADATIQNQKATLGIRKSALGIQQQNADTNRYRATHPSAGKGGKTGPSSASKRSVINKVGGVNGQFNSAIHGDTLIRHDGSHMKVDRAHEDQLVTLIQGKVGDPALAKAIVQQKLYGGVGPKTAARIKKRYHVPLSSLGFSPMQQTSKSTPKYDANGNAVTVVSGG